MAEVNQPAMRSERRRLGGGLRTGSLCHMSGLRLAGKLVFWWDRGHTWPSRAGAAGAVALAGRGCGSASCSVCFFLASASILVTIHKTRLS